MLTMLRRPLAVAFSKAKPNFINPFYEVTRMSQTPIIEIHADIIRSAILKIASVNPDWFYTETWLKDLLYLTPTDLTRRIERKQFEDDDIPDIFKK